MAQEDINKDLGTYIAERKSSKFWSRFKNRPRPQAVIREELREDVQKQAEMENISPQDKHELEAMEEKIEEVNKVEIQVEHDIEIEHESLLQKFFKKLHISRADSDDITSEDINVEHVGPANVSENVDEEKNEEHIDVHSEGEPYVELSPDEEELREVVHGLNAWISELPPEKLVEFKASRDFELYTNYLRKHNLIR